MGWADRRQLRAPASLSAILAGSGYIRCEQVLKKRGHEVVAWWSDVKCQIAALLIGNFFERSSARDQTLDLVHSNSTTNSRPSLILNRLSRPVQACLLVSLEFFLHKQICLGHECL